MTVTYLVATDEAVVATPSIPALRTARSVLLTAGAQACVGAMVIDGLYKWDAASTASDDGLNVVKPNDVGVSSPGRWTIFTPSGVTSLGGTTEGVSVVYVTDPAKPFIVGNNAASYSEKLGVYVTGAGTTLVTGIVAVNKTNATSGIPVQQGPMVGSLGTYWDGAAPQVSAWGFLADTVSTNPELRFVLTQASIGVGVEVVRLHVENSPGAPQMLIWSASRPVIYNQDSATVDAFPTIFYAQTTTAGHGAGFNFVCSGGIGANKNGGSFEIDLGPKTDSTGLPGHFYVRANGNPGLYVVGQGNADAAVYSGTETTINGHEPAGTFVAITNSSSVQMGGLVSFSHRAISGDQGAAVVVARSRGTRSVPAVVVTTDYIGALQAWAYDGTAWTNSAQLLFQVDSGGISSGNVPTKLVFFVGSGAGGTNRGTIFSDGSQSWSNNTGGTYSWLTGSSQAWYLKSGAAYCGTATSISEDAGSIVSVATTAGTRGFSAYQHSDDVNFAELNFFKSRGTRSAPTAVSGGSTDSIGRIRFVGYAGAAGGYASRAYITSYVDGTVVDGATPTIPMAVQIGTTAAAGSAVSRLNITSAGAWTANADTGQAYTFQITGLAENALQVSSTQVFVGSTIPVIVHNAESNANPAKVVLRKDRAGGIVSNGDVVGLTEYQSHDGSAIRVTAKIRAEMDGTVSSGNAPCKIVISTGTTTSATDRVSIASSGSQTHAIDAGGSVAWTVGSIGLGTWTAPSGTSIQLTFDATVPTTFTPGTMATSGTVAAAFTLAAGAHSGTNTGGNTGGAATFAGGNATGSSVNTHTGGASTFRGGDVTNAGAAGTFTGGVTTVRGGDVTGASGTRTGGNLDIRAGTGGSANGVLSLKDGATNRIQINATGIGLFGATPVAQPSGTGETVGFTSGAGTAVKDDSTFTGNVGTKAYRISDVVKALKNLGAMAAS